MRDTHQASLVMNPVNGLLQRQARWHFLLDKESQQIPVARLDLLAHQEPFWSARVKVLCPGHRVVICDGYPVQPAPIHPPRESLEGHQAIARIAGVAMKIDAHG
jgi:hypothetical protein